jgi:hypothetical protein
MHNDPGRFTTFVAYEYSTGADDGGSLHRNVVFEGSDRVPEIPFSRMHPNNPEDLWDWMDTFREAGVESKRTGPGVNTDVNDPFPSSIQFSHSGFVLYEGQLAMLTLLRRKELCNQAYRLLSR